MTPSNEEPTKSNTPNLDDFISGLEPELRVGGGATLDELYNLAQAIRFDLREGHHE